MGIGLRVAQNAAKSALLANQMSMSVISNNVSNSNVQGYHKQSVTLTENPVVSTSSGFFGQGTLVTSVIRSFDAELENNLRNATSQAGYRNAYLSNLGQIESLLIPNGDSTLVQSMNSYMDSVQDIASFPDDTSSRSAFISAAQNLASQFNSQYENLNVLKDSIAYPKAFLPVDPLDPTQGAVAEVGGTVRDVVDKINTLLQQIPEMNDTIARVENQGFNEQEANALRDERDRVVSELSPYLKVDVTENDDGKYIISIAGTNTVLVPDTGLGTATDVTLLNAEFYRADENSEPQLLFYADSYDYSGNLVESRQVYLPAECGELRGEVDARDVYLKKEMDDLKTYAVVFALTVNTQLASGKDLNGADGAALFKTGTAISTGKIMEVTDISPDEIGASADGLRGNGGNVQTLWKVLAGTEDNPIDAADPLYQYVSGKNIKIDGMTSSVADFANEYARQLSLDVYNANASASTASTSVEMFQNSVYSTSAVDMDTEMTNMLEIQRAYQASSQMISTIEKMFDSVFAMV